MSGSAPPRWPAWLLTIVGVALALGEKALTRSEQSLGWSGEAAVFGAAVSGAVCSVLYRPYVRTYPTVPVSAFAMLASVGFLAVLRRGRGLLRRLAALHRRRLGRRRVHRLVQRRRLLPLAVGARQRAGDGGHGPFSR